LESDQLELASLVVWALNFVFGVLLVLHNSKCIVLLV